jgi:hypothetical protein
MVYTVTLTGNYVYQVNGKTNIGKFPYQKIGRGCGSKKAKAQKP